MSKNWLAFITVVGLVFVFISLVGSLLSNSMYETIIWIAVGFIFACISTGTYDELEQRMTREENAVLDAKWYAVRNEHAEIKCLTEEEISQSDKATQAIWDNIDEIRRLLDERDHANQKDHAEIAAKLKQPIPRYVVVEDPDRLGEFILVDNAYINGPGPLQISSCWIMRYYAQEMAQDEADIRNADLFARPYVVCMLDWLIQCGPLESAQGILDYEPDTIGHGGKFTFKQTNGYVYCSVEHALKWLLERPEDWKPRNTV
jgi:hypothetical protein